jgi:CheY-like chemotaxis protein
MSDGRGKSGVFDVRWSALAMASGSGAPGGPADVAPGSGPRTGGAANVVVVEDNVDSAEMLCELVGLGGPRCETAHDGEGGLATIERLRPEVAFVDLGLPGIDGLELARRVRAQPELAGVFLVALTGYGETSDRERAREAGFDEHLVKPVDPDAVMTMLTRRRPR